jgi:hypothetical protein
LSCRSDFSLIYNQQLGLCLNYLNKNKNISSLEIFFRPIQPRQLSENATYTWDPHGIVLHTHSFTRSFNLRIFCAKQYLYYSTWKNNWLEIYLFPTKSYSSKAKMRITFLTKFSIVALRTLAPSRLMADTAILTSVRSTRVCSWKREEIHCSPKISPRGRSSGGVYHRLSLKYAVHEGLNSFCIPTLTTSGNDHKDKLTKWFETIFWKRK